MGHSLLKPHRYMQSLKRASRLWLKSLRGFACFPGLITCRLLISGDFLIASHIVRLLYIYTEYVIVIQWFVHLYVEIIHELILARGLSPVQVDNHDIAIL